MSKSMSIMYKKLLFCFVAVLGSLVYTNGIKNRVTSISVGAVNELFLHGDLLYLSFYIALAIAMIYLYYVNFCCLINRYKGPYDIGFQTDLTKGRRDMINRQIKLKATGNLPPAYANGWYPLIESHRLRRGETKSINFAGSTFAAFRDDNGVARVIDAYCPHLGANLAAGGRVSGDCIECPFHGWRFNGEDGRCVSVPALKDGKIPDLARVKTHNVQEANGWVHLWYDAEDRTPTWTIPENESFRNGEYRFCGRTEHWIHCHMEDIPENGADIGHLSIVHGPSLLSGVDLSNMTNTIWSFTTHTWESSWESKPSPDEHLAYMDLVQGITLFGTSLPFSRVKVHVEQIGPAIVYLHFDTMFGSCIIQHMVCPVEPLLQKLVHNIYASRWMPLFVAKIIMTAMALQVERDMTIWNNKTYQSRPLLLKTPEDSLINRHRRWFKQFYSENSPKVRAGRGNELDW